MIQTKMKERKWTSIAIKKEVLKKLTKITPKNLSYSDMIEKLMLERKKK